MLAGIPGGVKSQVVTTESLSWFDARQYCIANGFTDLAVFDSISMGMYINAVPKSILIWIGAVNWHWNWMDNGM